MGIDMSLYHLQSQEEVRRENVGGVVIRETASEITRTILEVQGKGKAVATVDEAAQSLLDLQQAKKQSLRDQYIFYSTNDVEVVTNKEQSNSKTDTEILDVAEEKDTGHMDEDHAGSNPGKSYEDQAEPDPQPMHEDFIVVSYPELHDSAMHTMEEQVRMENPPSSSGTLASLKELDDANPFTDQFFNGQPVEEDPVKTHVDIEAESMVTVPIHQASSSAPPLSTLVINLTPRKPVSTIVATPILTSATITTTTLPPPAPLPTQPPTQSTSDPELVNRVSNLEKKSEVQAKENQALESRLSKLENVDINHKIDKTINDVVKEAVTNAVRASLL
ncbi:hypothetical protein Tco_0560587 [Tanacetum coccineum]